MEPRCGKTLSTILALENLGISKALVLCPASVQGVWQEELTERGFTATIISGSPSTKRNKLKKEGVHIITFESSWRGLITPSTYPIIVFDEAIKLQSGSSKVGTFWRNAFNQSQKYWALSGAPCPEGALQLANQALCTKGTWFKYTDFYEYLNDNWVFDYDRKRFFPQSYAHARNAIAGFHKASFCMAQKDLGFTGLQLATRKILATKQDEDLLTANLIGAVDDARAMRWQQASSGISFDTKQIDIPPTKLLAIIESVQDTLALEPATQIVVMHRFSATGAWLSDKLNCPWIHGGTSTESRIAVVNGYKQGKSRVIVCQIDTAKMGLDFSANGNGVLFFAEHSWSGDTFIQATQRIMNITRKTPAFAYTFCLCYEQGSVDLQIYKAVSQKKAFNHRLLSTSD